MKLANQTILKVDESGLFWRKIPQRTFIALEGNRFPRFKPVKDRLTAMVGANAAGDSENQRALKNKSKAGCDMEV